MKDKDTTLMRDEANKYIECVILQDLYNNIKEYPNFPKEGVLFKDILPLLSDPRLRSNLMYQLKNTIPMSVTCIVAPESRGFLLGMLIAQECHLKFIPIRKPGKLPGEVRVKSYDTEYSSDTLEMQASILDEKDVCWFIDDIWATGGTFNAVKSLVNTEATLLGGTVLLDIFNNRDESVVELFGKIKGDTNDKD